MMCLGEAAHIKGIVGFLFLIRLDFLSVTIVTIELVFALKKADNPVC